MNKIKNKYRNNQRQDWEEVLLDFEDYNKKERCEKNNQS